VALQSTLGHAGTTGEDSEDLRQWLRRQVGCPSIEVTALLSCSNPVHGSEPPTWFFVEADSATGVARRRCVACADQQSVLDSADHWNFPAMHACLTCGQSMVELAAGLHTEADPDGGPDHVTWLALACRCVACGRIAGLTDMVVNGVDVEELVPRL
jgi:hypothetical protein